MTDHTKQKYWFKRRRYGYGWVPATWQGWLTVAVFLTIVFGGTIVLKDAPRYGFSNEVGIYLIILSASILGLVFISLKKGPKPKWRWGKTDADNPREDF